MTKASTQSTAERSCTCHPDDCPPQPCARKYALSECRASLAALQEPVAQSALTAAVRAHIVDLRNCVQPLTDAGFTVAGEFAKAADELERTLLSVPAPQVEPELAHPLERCSRCGRYKDGTRPCPNGDKACPWAVPAPAAQSPNLPDPVRARETAKAAPVDHSWFSQASLDVTAERRRQIEREGWAPEHDDQHNNSELALAAASYAIADRAHMSPPGFWPWDKPDFKPKDRRSNLVRAGALILAEIERLDRKNGLTVEGGK